MLQCFVLHIQQARYLVNKSGSHFPRNILHEINDIISHERNYEDTDLYFNVNLDSLIKSCEIDILKSY